MNIKKWPLLILMSVATTVSFAQIPALLSKKTLKKLPGVVPVKYDMVFMDRGEMTNLDWKEYINWLAVNKPSEYSSMRPDSSVWEKSTAGIAYGAPMMKHYFRHHAYHAYPVVGINQQQAKAYCAWRAARVMETEWFKKSELDSIIFRLPTRKEWQMAARGTLNANSTWPWEGESVRFEEPKKLKGLIRLNYLLKNSGGANSNSSESTNITAPSYSYWENTFQLYNMCGNVAEWTQDGYAVGGSWNDFIMQCKINAKHPRYTDTFRSNTIGFRCIMEVVSFKKTQQITPVKLDAKTIEKNLGLIPDSNQFWFVSFTETPQNWYASFLKENNTTTNQIQHQNWLKQTPYLAMINYGKIEAFAEYPVVNISHTAAVNYCKWIEAKYNKDPKRTYKKVEFRLPTEEEWLYAAQVGNPATLLPQNGDQLRNSKGCYLYNFLPQVGSSKNAFHQAAGAEDGSEYPAKVNAYFPNDYGLYNCSGNVSEMLKSEGLCKGGSWLSKGEDIFLKSSAVGYTQPRCDLGFRVVMVVLER